MSLVFVYEAFRFLFVAFVVLLVNHLEHVLLCAVEFGLSETMLNHSLVFGSKNLNSVFNLVVLKHSKVHESILSAQEG